jgi:hypothetical protein
MAATVVCNHCNQERFSGFGKWKGLDRHSTLNNFHPQSNVSWLGVSTRGYSRGAAEVYMSQEEELDDPSNRGPSGIAQDPRGSMYAPSSQASFSIGENSEESRVNKMQRSGFVHHRKPG